MQIRRPMCLFVAVFTILLFFFSGMLRQKTTLLFDDGEEALVSGIVCRREIRDDATVYHLKDLSVRGKTASTGQTVKLKQKAFCYPGKESRRLWIGERVLFSGQIALFSPAENEGQFDEAAYYERKGYAFRLFQAKVLSSNGRRARIREAMADEKERAAAFFEAAAGKATGSVLGAITLGEKSGVDREIKNLYRQNGIAHVLAISGLHISLLGLFLYRLLCKSGLPVALSAGCAGGMILLYGLFVGGGSSVFRAGSMLFLQLLADVLGRTYDMLTAMAVSGFLLLLFLPSCLTDAGFLLSFLAVLGIALQPGRIREEGERKKKGSFLQKKPVRSIINALGVSVSISLFTLPVLLYYYFSFPLYSLILNLLLVPLLWIVPVFGLAAAALESRLLLFPAVFVLDLYEAVCRLFGRLPFHTIITGRPKVWQIVLYYGFLAAFLLIRKKGRTVFVCAGLLFLFWNGRTGDGLDLLSVGQGECILLRDASGHAVLCDGGSSDEKEVGRYRLIPCLKYNGIRHLDAVYVSHPHEDHISALIELFEYSREEGIRIGALCIGESFDPSFGGLLQLAEKEGIPVRILSPGMRQRYGKIDILTLYPKTEDHVEDENDTSLVLWCGVAGFDVLLTGDLSGAQDDALLNALDRFGIGGVYCLKAEHHGSSSGNSKQLLARLHPRIALISCGRENRYGHPHPETLKRLEKAGCRIYCTAEEGQITLRIRKNRVRVTTFFAAGSFSG